jgi:hypothetical protein
MTSVRMSSRARKPIKLFDPGTGPASKWKYDMVVNLAMRREKEFYFKATY